MNIIIDGHIFQLQSYGGISRIYHEILPTMCEIDPSLSIYIYYDKRYGLLKQQLPQHPRIFHMAKPDFDFHEIINSWLRRIWSFRNIRLRNVDVWHSTYYTPAPRLQKNSIATFYDMVYEKLPDLFTNQDADRREKAKSAYQADIIITISESTKNDVLEFYDIDPNKVHAIPLAASEFFRSLTDKDITLPSGIKEDFILYVGKRWKHKNFQRLIQAYGNWSHRKEFALVVVGPSWGEEDKEYTDIVEREDVILLSDVNDEQLVSLYNTASLFVYPSLYEGFGIPILEAIQCGCPITISDIPVHQEVAGSNAIYFDPYNISSIEDALTKGIEKQGQSEKLEDAIRWSQQYSWYNTAQKTLEIYHLIQS